MTDINAFIDDKVKSNDVFLFMKGSPDAPRCGFSSLAVQILDHIGADFVGVDVLQSDALRDGIKVGRILAGQPRFYSGAEPCRSGQSWVWDGVRFDVLWPQFAAAGVN